MTECDAVSGNGRGAMMTRWCPVTRGIDIPFSQTAASQPFRLPVFAGACPAGNISAAGEHLPHHVAANAFDGANDTKWTDPSNSSSSWIQIAYHTPVYATTYSLTSADEADGDPKKWQLLGDGVVIGEESDVVFKSRQLPKVFAVGSPGVYSAYRLHILDIWGNTSARTQIAELTIHCGVLCPVHVCVQAGDAGGTGTFASHVGSQHVPLTCHCTGHATHAFHCAKSAD